MNQYKLETINTDVVARVYINGKKTSACTDVIPESLRSSAAILQEQEDNKPF